MRWFKGSIRSSIYGLLGNPVAPSDSMLETGTEDIREAMLALLGESGTKQFANVTRRIRYANDIQALWYLRGDLMAALASTRAKWKRAARCSRSPACSKASCPEA